MSPWLAATLFEIEFRSWVRIAFPSNYLFIFYQLKSFLFSKSFCNTNFWFEKENPTNTSLANSERQCKWISDSADYLPQMPVVFPSILGSPAGSNLRNNFLVGRSRLLVLQQSDVQLHVVIPTYHSRLCLQCSRFQKFSSTTPARFSTLYFSLFHRIFCFLFYFLIILYFLCS